MIFNKIYRNKTAAVVFRYYKSMIILLCASFITSCATTTESYEPIDNQDAQALVAAGDFYGAAAVYEQQAKQNRGARDRYLLKAAEVLREENDFSKIVQITDGIRRAKLAEQEKISYDLLLAEMALHNQDAETALHLATLPADVGNKKLTLWAASLRSFAYDQLQRPLDALSERIFLIGHVNKIEIPYVEAEISESLKPYKVEQVNGLLMTLSMNDMRRPWLEQVLQQRNAAPVLPFLSPRQAAPIEHHKTVDKLALLVPLTGTLANAGQALQDGFMAAYFTDKRSRPALHVYDTGDTEQSVLAAYQKAVAEGNQYVVGPLAREQVTALFKQASLPIPVLALNTVEGRVAPPSGSQQFALLPEEEGSQAAHYVISHQLQNAIIIRNAEDWSLRASKVFHAQLALHNKSIVREIIIPLEAHNIAGLLQKQLAQQTFDTIFMALRASQGHVVVPQLRALGHVRETFLATSHIYSGAIMPAVDRDLDGVIFSDAPWLFNVSLSAPHYEIAQQNFTTVVSAPRLFAMGMDAYRLIPHLHWLMQEDGRYFPGATGQLMVDLFGRTHRLLTWLQFNNGTPQPLEGALTAEFVAFE